MDSATRRRILALTAIALAAIALPAMVLRGAALAQSVIQRADATSSGKALGPALAALIRQSRDAAIGRGVQEMPATIRSAFNGYIPAAVLQDVRWRVDGETGLLALALFQSGAIRAVTVDNVILFANSAEAANEKLWAHELHHVVQFRQWGIDEFAVRFIDDRRTIEHAAREFRWGWMKETGRVPRP